MSRIYFHTPAATAAVYGAERARMSAITTDRGRDALIATLGRDGLERVLRPVFRRQLNRAVGPWENTLRWMVSPIQDDPIFSHNGKAIDHWQLMLNTLIAGGSDAMRLICRLHAQCEIHCYAEGPDRAWLASLIHSAIDEQRLRTEIGTPPDQVDSGWAKVIELLHADDAEPVVLSYSVTDTFPNSSASTWEPDPSAEDHDAWFALDEADRWRMSMEYLRGERRQSAGLRLDPNDWTDYRFGHSLTTADLLGEVHA